MARSWAELPIGRVIGLPGVNAAAPAVEPPPGDAPAILTYFPEAAPSVAAMVSAALSDLQTAATELFPAWLPGAELIEGPGGAGARAVRALALRLASASHHFGPFLADLAELSLAGDARRAPRFGPEVRAAGLARVLAAGFGRRHTAILVGTRGALTPLAEEALVAGCEWLAHQGGFGVWLAGPSASASGRVESVTLTLPAVHAGEPEPPRWAMERSTPPVIGYPAVAGRPHPASEVEKSLERALAARAWARGRAWNQVYRPTPLANPIRVDLLWRRERCVVEIDGREHRSRRRFADDRNRDVRLQMDGYAVLRFTNEQVLTDIENVVGQMERFLGNRRAGTPEGTHHA